MCESVQAKIACGVLTAIIITSAFLIGFSFSKVDANDVGLNFNQNSMTIDTSQVYQGGVHFLGLGHKFITFPTGVQTIGLSVSARTQDGLAIRITAAFTYRLDTKTESLASLYMLLKEDYHSAFTLLASRVVADVASTFSAFAFYQNRDLINVRMQAVLNSALADVHAILNVFNLASFELPSSFQQAITQTQVALQESQRVEFEIQNAITQKNTLVAQSLQQAQIIELQANASASEIGFQLASSTQRIKNLVDAEVISYGIVKDTLQFTDEELNAFVWLDVFQQSQSPKTVNVATPSALL